MVKKVFIGLLSLVVIWMVILTVRQMMDQGRSYPENMERSDGEPIVLGDGILDAIFEGRVYDYCYKPCEDFPEDRLEYMGLAYVSYEDKARLADAMENGFKGRVWPADGPPVSFGRLEQLWDKVGATDFPDVIKFRLMLETDRGRMERLDFAFGGNRYLVHFFNMEGGSRSLMLVEKQKQIIRTL